MPNAKMKTKKTIIIIATVFLIVVVGFKFTQGKTFFDFTRFVDKGRSLNHKPEKYEQGTEVGSLIQNTSNFLQNKDLQVITSPCAVLISPNLKKLEKLKKENTEDDFNTIVDDNQYYMATSIQYLDSLKVKILHRNSEGTLVFKTIHGTIFKFQADSVYWGVLFFNGRTKPLEADMTAINQDYELYMRK